MLATVSGFGLIAVDALGLAATPSGPAPPPMPTATAPPTSSASTKASPPARTTGTPRPPRGTPTKTPPGPKTGTAEAQANAATPNPLASVSRPMRVDIPRIEVAAPLTSVGRAEDGSIDVPPPQKPYLAAWYDDSAVPGHPGRTVIVGHLDSRYSGPAVFYHLGALRKGDTVTVTRRDGIVVEYVVDGTAAHPRDEFPADQIYGPSSRSELRLITCGGSFRQADGWSHNVIVYAHMTSWHRASDAERKRPLRYDTPKA
ncbi:class F sortase [Thermasporomyces composti]|uniref:class F sortase n=1 Tax=Thermasporomyces composti TaxID=696763 RepID=UPI00147347A4|nr:class F sortase [Thermasporomyces composti]